MPTAALAKYSAITWWTCRSGNRSSDIKSFALIFMGQTLFLEDRCASQYYILFKVVIFCDAIDHLLFRNSKLFHRAAGIIEVGMSQTGKLHSIVTFLLG